MLTLMIIALILVTYPIGKAIFGKIGYPLGLFILTLGLLFGIVVGIIGVIVWGFLAIKLGNI